MRDEPVDKRSADEHQEKEAARLVIEVEGESNDEDHHLRLAALKQSIKREEEDKKDPEETTGEKHRSLRVICQHMPKVGGCSRKVEIGRKEIHLLRALRNVT